MLETEVSQKMWKSLMGNDPSKFEGDDLPVENVSWNDCQEYIKRLNDKGAAPSGWRFTLPTDAQWEVAARAGRADPFPWGETLNGDRANCDGSFPYGTEEPGEYLAKTVAVNSYEPNAWVLYCVAGNVWEWVQDVSAPYSQQDATDPLTEEGGTTRVNRGGGWNSLPKDCRVADRSEDDPTDKFDNLGFRMALERER